MKKIALSLVALSALSLAACGGNTTHSATNNLAADAQNAINQANSDIANASATATQRARHDAERGRNATDAAGAAVANASDAANNAVQNAVR